jgi:ubiquinone/menaquinone biosynthesis C-methylase UbiE
MDAAEPMTLSRSFGRAAADYELGRPHWPREVAEVAGIPPDASVLDLAAGTGKLTRVLLDRFANVVAVEPDDAMRALLPAECEALVGTAETIPLPDDAVEAVFCAEAFHWFDWPVALAEIARVLKPRGTLVVVFNLPDDTEPPLPEEMGEILESYRRPGVEAGGAIVESGAWREAFPQSPFEELRTEVFEHVHVQDTAQLIAHVLSVSIFAQLPARERQDLAAELRSVVPQRMWTTPLRVEAHWTRLRP